MPLIVFEVGGELTKEQKAELVKKLTHSSAEITGIREEAFVIYIHELNEDNIGLGGKLLTQVIAERG
jgi:4-oxalocrotonate tautomerase